MKETYLKVTNKVNSFIDKVFSQDPTKSPLRKVMTSVIAILAGLLIAGFFILTTKNQFGKTNNFFDTYRLIFKEAFKGEGWKDTLLITSIFALFGMSVAFSFKTGLINIGVSGQMLLGASVATYFMLKQHSLSPGIILLSFLITIILGFVWGAIAGILKAYFNVHEVVTTILLNWIAFYIVQQMFDTGTEFDAGDSSPSSIVLTSGGLSFPEFVTHYKWLIGIISVVIVAFISWFVISKTTFGFNMKVVGESSTAAHYAGIDVKIKKILAMGISGAIAGLGGALLYFFKEQSIPKMSSVPTFGFDGIVIALLAFNSSFGCVAAGLFYAILYRGPSIIGLRQGLGDEVYQIVVGIIVYMAAISSIFMKFDPLRLIKERIWVMKCKNYKQQLTFHKKNKELIKETYKADASLAKNEIIKNKPNYKVIQIRWKTEKNKIKVNSKSTSEEIIAYDKRISAINAEFKAELESLGFYGLKDAKKAKRHAYKTERLAWKSIKEVYKGRIYTAKDKFRNRFELLNNEYIIKYKKARMSEERFLRFNEIKEQLTLTKEEFNEKLVGFKKELKASKKSDRNSVNEKTRVIEKNLTDKIVKLKKDYLAQKQELKAELKLLKSSSKISYKSYKSHKVGLNKVTREYKGELYEMKKELKAKILSFEMKEVE